MLRRVLLVENDELDRRAFARLFEKEQLPYDYMIVESVREAREILQRQKFDVIFVDYMLDDGTGFDVLMPARSTTPVIFITGTGSEEIAVRAMRSGAVDYLIKDIDRTYLTLIPLTIERAVQSRQNEEMLRTLSGALMSSGDCIYITNLMDEITYVNKAFCETYGYDSDEVLGSNCGRLFTQETGALKQEEVSDFECVQVRKNGTEFPVSMTRSTIRNDNEVAFARVVVVRDISERKQAKQALQESEERYRSVVNVMGNGIVLQDSAGRTIAHNTSAERILGLSGEQLMGRTPVDPSWRVFHEDGSPFHGDAQPAIVTLQTGEPQRDVVMGIHKPDDHVTWIVINTEPLRRPGEDAPYAVVASFTDITPLKSTIAERDELIESLDSFAHTVAHDLKNPAGTVLGFAQVLADGVDDFERDELVGYLRLVETTAARIIKIIDALLLLASTQHREDVASDDVALSEVAAQVEQRLSKLIADHDAVVNYPDDLPDVRGYQPWVEEVLMNYVSNAIKYGGRPPQVNIRASETEGDTVTCWVCDNGQGLTPEEQQQLFVPFKRITRASVEGHGLGLSIVRQIVERLDGTAGVTSEVGKGSEFWFRLPAAG